MPAYMVGSFTITNPEGFAPYGGPAMERVVANGGEPLVIDTASEVIEGEPRQVTIVLRFPNKEAAHAWYNDPEYRKIIHLRQENAEGTIVFVDGVPAPGAS
jgi:uncharacterized protein (DUF1330 family)